VEAIDHPVSRYALDVLEGNIAAGPLVRMACERHLLDLETGADRGLVFDTDAADMVIRFAKVLRHTTGSMAGASLTLQPWQVFRHGSVFGWKHAETGLRRFRSTYHQVAKKNGKTTDTAVPMLYTQLFDGEGAPQGYCAATTRDQAGLLFNEIKRMIRVFGALAVARRLQDADPVAAHERLHRRAQPRRQQRRRHQPAFCGPRRGPPLDRPRACGRGDQLDDCPVATDRLGDHDRRG